jgi:hypothetical protein
MNNIELKQLRQTPENNIARLTEKEVLDVVGGAPNQVIQVPSQKASKINNAFINLGDMFGSIFN